MVFLALGHPRPLQGDTAGSRPYMRVAGHPRRPRRLRDLALEVLGLDIQVGGLAAQRGGGNPSSGNP